MMTSTANEAGSPVAAQTPTGHGDEIRPDGRAISAETARLRRATRALRYHLDELPIDYRLGVPGDRFLAGLAFMFARQRYDCADSMIGASFGGTVLGSIARSLFVDGLRWLWIGQQPERRRSLLGDLLEERNRICTVLHTADCSCPNLARWLMPLPDIADLTGESMTWLDAPAMPGEDELLDGFLGRAGSGADPSAGRGRSELIDRAGALLDMAGLRGAVMVLAHAGHGNYLGLQSSLTDDGLVGHDLRADHEALFMQVAAVGVTLTLLGSATAVPELWPSEVPQEQFLQRAVDLTAEVTSAALVIHRLGAARRASMTAVGPPRPRRRGLLRGDAVLTADDLLPDVNSAADIGIAAEEFYMFARRRAIDPWAREEPTLHALLTYLGGHSNLQAVMSTYDRQGSEVIAVLAARMQLEEAARLIWRFSAGGGPEFEARAKQYFDEFRSRRKKTINALTGSGVAKADAERILELPSNVRLMVPHDDIAKGRKALPTISSMLCAMGEPFAEPGWLDVAYSLLSQVTHSTPIGQMHTMRVRDGIWHGGELTPEMLALTLDTACLASAHLIGLSAVVLSDMSGEARLYSEGLKRRAVRVHRAAQFVHGLD
jgi:hypothetical protein